MLHYEQVTALILKYWRAELTPKENIQLQEWIDADPANQALLKRFEDIDWVIQEMAKHEQGPSQGFDERFWAKWEQVQRQEEQPKKRNKPIRSIGRYAAAAVLVLAVGSYIVYNVVIKPPVQQNTVSVIAEADSSQSPSSGSNKAILHLADGTQHIIDTAEGDVAMVDNLKFTNADGIIFCKAVMDTPAASSASTENITLTTVPVVPKFKGYHTLETPRGGRYTLVLPDGTRIWLNAESRLRFPAADTGNRRAVYLEGEAYFEVAHNSGKPFIVHVNDAEVKVTGTHFNIAAYANEPRSKVTLIEGQISVHSGGVVEPVAPNYSAIFSTGSQPRVIKEPNIEKIIAWKNGQFVWEGVSLTSALQDVERWYNVTVQYEGAPPAIIVDKILASMDKPLTRVMDALTTNLNGDTIAYYKLQGRILHVSKQRLH